MPQRYTGPVTRELVRAHAAAQADDPTTLGEVVHEEFNADIESGGFAFHHDGTLYICGYAGAQSWAVDPVWPTVRREAVETFWRVSRRRNRRVDPATLPPQSQAAIAALVAGVRSVSDLDPQPLADDAERAGADYLLVLLQRGAPERTQVAALRIVAVNDTFLSPVTHGAHPCPVCGAPAIGTPRYDRAVCDDCRSRVVCEHERRVEGYNTGFVGRFLARHVDDDSTCEPITSPHRIWIDGHPGVMDEAHFGGIVVEGYAPPRVTLVRGDITRERVDGLVNAASTAMRGGGGVDGAIHRAGGPAVLADCIARFPRGLAVGDAGFTTAGDLPVFGIVHTVGPNYGAGQRDRSLLFSCYRRSLEVASEHRLYTLAFPLISAGVYAWPLQDAADVAVKTLTTTPSAVREVRIVAFDDAAHDAVADALAARLRRGPPSSRDERRAICDRRPPPGPHGRMSTFSASRASISR